MSKYKVQVVMSYWQTIEVDASNEMEARATAYDLFDIEQADQGEGETFSVVELIEGEEK